MKVYVCTDHAGHWPIGVASVVIAAGEENARLLLEEELEKRGLDSSQEFTLQELDKEVGRAYVLHEGEY